MAVLAGLFGCQTKTPELPAQTASGENGLPRTGGSEHGFTPAEIRRDLPVGLDTANLARKPAETTIVATRPVPDSKPALVSKPGIPAPLPTPAKTPAIVAVPASKPVVGEGGGVPGETGDWVLQVNVHRSEAEAQGQVGKLGQQGIPAYAVPIRTGDANLSGNYWRVRVGRFVSRADAQAYGTSILEPKGLKFWIDRKSNENGKN